MKFENYNITDINGNSNCIIRTFSKLFNKSYDEILNELLDLAKSLRYDNFTEIEVFEKYLYNNNYVNYIDKDIKIKDLKLPLGKYAVFCYDKKDFYHMLPIIDNTIYDKNNESLNLYVIKVYKEN